MQKVGGGEYVAPKRLLRVVGERQLRGEKRPQEGCIITQGGFWRAHSNRKKVSKKNWVPCRPKMGRPEGRRFFGKRKKKPIPDSS